MELISLPSPEQKGEPKQKVDRAKQQEFNRLIKGKGPIDIQKITTLLEEHHVNPTYTYENGRNVLHYAFLKGDLQLAQCLIDNLKMNHPDKLKKLLNQVSAEGRTPFSYAITIEENTARLNMLKQLITLGALSSQLETEEAMEQARRDNDLGLLRLLEIPYLYNRLQGIINKGKDGKYIDELIKQSDKEALRYSIGVVNEKGNTLLHEAASSTDKMNNEGIINHLMPIIKNDTSILNKLNEEGKSALHITIQKGAYRNFEVLRKAGASLTLPDTTGKTPLQMAQEAVNALGQENAQRNHSHVKAILQKLEALLKEKGGI
jgi:ankyrin repeat protein